MGSAGNVRFDRLDTIDGQFCGDTIDFNYEQELFMQVSGTLK